MSRNRANGQFTYSTDFERPCVCGHALGIHSAEAPHDCGAGDAHNVDPSRYPTPLASCGCMKFRLKRSKVVANE